MREGFGWDEYVVSVWNFWGGCGGGGGVRDKWVECGVPVWVCHLCSQVEMLWGCRVDKGIVDVCLDEVFFHGVS